MAVSTKRLAETYDLLRNDPAPGRAYAAHIVGILLCESLAPKQKDVYLYVANSDGNVTVKDVAIHFGWKPYLAKRMLNELWRMGLIKHSRGDDSLELYRIGRAA